MACIHKGAASAMVLTVQLGMLAEVLCHKRVGSAMVACTKAVITSGKHRDWSAAFRLLRDGLA